ncbi:cyclase family protein [Rhodococcus sp. MALMAid1271]|uniref:cyclase family protein n=1 Tax=Rhodococcus sp. MALMAid1271 TaxID=3411744 RepID=UPI003BA311A8
MKRRQLFRRATTGLAVLIGARLVAPETAGALPGTGSAQPARPTVPLDRLVQIVSLSHINDPEFTPIFPGDPEFSLETAFTVAEDGFYLQYVKEGEHTGTHWGAPAHFREGGLTADQLDPEDLFLPAVKIDIRDRAATDPDYAITVADLQNWEKSNGPIPPGSAVIAWTGWASRWGTDAYANADSDGVTHQPGFSAEAAQWLIDTGKLGERGALGTDTFGPDLGNDETYPVSVKLYDRRRISLENLTNLEAIPTTGAYVLVGGTINRDGSGSPATIFGLVPRIP